MYVCQIYRKKNSPSDAGLLRSCEIWFGSYLYVKGLSWESLFDFIEKKYVQFITCILLLKSMFFLRFWKISGVENLETTPRSIYLELLITGVVF